MGLKLDKKTKEFIHKEVREAILEKFKGKDCEGFVTAALDYRPDHFSMYALVIGGSKSLLEEAVEAELKGILRDIVSEIVSPEFRDALKYKLEKHITQNHMYLAGKAALDAFMHDIEYKLKADKIEFNIQSSDY